MVTEDYVNEEIAMLLKENGFDGYCDLCFNFIEIPRRIVNVPSDGKISYEDGILREEIVLVPTIQMAMKWLMERHDIHPNIVVEVYGPYALYKIDRIFDGNEEKWVDFKSDENPSNLYNKREEACEAAIKYCLENLI